MGGTTDANGFNNYYYATSGYITPYPYHCPYCAPRCPCCGKPMTHHAYPWDYPYWQQPTWYNNSETITTTSQP